MGRLITFLARLIQDGNAQPGIRGIGISGLLLLFNKETKT